MEVNKMDLIEAIFSRRSVRNYKNEKVPKEIINKLLEIATQAPSSSNSQPWTFAVIQNPTLLKSYSDKAKKLLLKLMGDNPDPQGYRSKLSSPDFNTFYNASTLIIIYANSDRLQSTGDCSMAAQNLMLAAHSYGLGTCWIGFSTPLVNSDEFKQELGIPLTYKAVAPVILGYPDVSLSTIPKKPPEVLIWK